MNPAVTPEAIELELKFGFPDGSADEIERALVAADLSAESLGTQLLDNQYFDTCDGLLHHQNVAIRVRSIGAAHEMTVKIRAPDEGGLTRRQEWNVSIATPHLAMDALTELPLPPDVLSAISGHRLQPVFSNRFHRTDWRVTLASTTMMVSFDQGLVSSAHTSSPVSEIEIELLTGHISELIDAGLRLTDRLPVYLAVISKAERGDCVIRQQPPRSVQSSDAMAQLHAVSRALDPLSGPDYASAIRGLEALGLSASACAQLNQGQIPIGLARWMVERSMEDWRDAL